MFLKIIHTHSMLCGGFCMKKYLLKYVSENYKIIKIMIICLLVGLAVGILIFQMLNQEVKTELINSIKSTLDISKSNNFESINIIKNGVKSNLLITSIIYLVAITLIAPICICGINFLKGFAIGIYIQTLIGVLGFGKGILAILLIVVLPNVIYLPSYIYMSTNAINFHYLILESDNKISLLVKESYKIVITLSLMMLSVLIEQLASFGVINAYIR